MTRLLSGSIVPGPHCSQSSSVPSAPSPHFPNASHYTRLSRCAGRLPSWQRNAVQANPRKLLSWVVDRGRVSVELATMPSRIPNMEPAHRRTRGGAGNPMGRKTRATPTGYRLRENHVLPGLTVAQGRVSCKFIVFFLACYTWLRVGRAQSCGKARRWCGSFPMQIPLSIPSSC
ncbi:hypothetical protein CLIM01_09196 [Colletotrichum limetticola]|uniref:Uncharacterized protein n=1 Tax=Colletotrichum limetticola TaxID=1209924 RepID=A0ABQ9PPJ5_9PEZI|nr:hypothetical protein CLIM01_09196 [Colletotrichum limetticola]